MKALFKNEAIKAVIYGGISGLSLNDREREFFKENPACGYILFKRNIDTPKQVKALIDSLKNLHDYPLLFMIDQEGGRVRRLRPPHWPFYPAAFDFTQTDLNETHRLGDYRLGAQMMAEDLRALGFNLNCAPVCDVGQIGAHDIIGDRAYGFDAHLVASRARAVCDGLLAGGVLPCIKHIPGHGRALADSHLECPKIDADIHALQTDFYPFRALNDMPVAMTAHVLYEAIDAENLATESEKVIRLIREDIGFQGLIVCDDLSMKALKGSVFARTKRASKAGCDLLMHCNGTLKEMSELYRAAPRLKGNRLKRFMAALDRLSHQPVLLSSQEKSYFEHTYAKAKDQIDPTEVLARQKGLA